MIPTLQRNPPHCCLRCDTDWNQLQQAIEQIRETHEKDAARYTAFLDGHYESLRAYVDRSLDHLRDEVRGRKDKR
jgi:hypothetical protein